MMLGEEACIYLISRVKKKGRQGGAGVCCSPTSPQVIETSMGHISMYKKERHSFFTKQAHVISQGQHLRRTQIPTDNFTFEILVKRAKNITVPVTEVYLEVTTGMAGEETVSFCLLLLPRLCTCTHIYTHVCKTTTHYGHYRGGGENTAQRKSHQSTIKQDAGTQEQMAKH